LRTPVVIDTNVLVTADGGPETSRLCVELCQKRILEIKADGCVVLDSEWQIVKEYTANLKRGRQPGLGLRFLEWILNTRSTHGHCSWIRITPHHERGYEEFPEHEGLRKFDWSDRKFVAVAAKCSPSLAIIQATDSKWVGWCSALNDCGITVEFICKDEIQKKYEKKTKYRV
jgi:hypothetical protein